MRKKTDIGQQWEALFEMNRRGDDRIDMELPCRVIFPKLWPGSLDGFTANMHRYGLMVACRVKPGRELPALGEVANVHIELPAHENFPPKFMCCETTLLRIEELGGEEFHFAMQITTVDFDETSSACLSLMEMDTDTCGYIM